MSCAAQVFRLTHLKFARGAICQPPGQVAYLFQLPFRNSFLRRWVGTLVQWLSLRRVRAIHSVWPDPGEWFLATRSTLLLDAGLATVCSG